MMMRKFNFPAWAYAGIFILGLLFIGCNGSSSSSSDDDDDEIIAGALGVEATVNAPTASVSVAPLRSLARALLPRVQRVDETALEGATVHVEDLSGTEIPGTTPCTTGADGTCEVTGMTPEQMEAGFIVVAVNPDGTELHTYQQPETDEVDALEVSGDPLAAPVNTETDLTYAILASTCEDDLAGCGTTIDPKCIVDAMAATVGDEDPSADDSGGYLETLFAAHATAWTNGGAAADLMNQALQGDPTAFEAAAGSAIDDVPVSDAVTHSLTVINTIKDAYCNIDSETGEAPWEGIKTEAGDDFDPAAIAGIFKRFVPAELGQYPVADLRAFGQAIPAIPGGFQAGQHNEFRQMAVQSFRQGAFADPSQAGMAFGFMMASFPPPPTDGTFTNWNFDGFDPAVGAMAMKNTFLEYTGTASSFVDPSVIYSKWKDVLGDPTLRSGLATNGSSFVGNFMTGFIQDGGNFDPSAHLDDFKSVPGGPCSGDDGCLPCDSCVNSVCVSNSTTMGSECDPSSDADACDGVTSCVVPPLFTTAIAVLSKGRCMCATGVPMGAPIHQGGGGGPLIFGQGGEGGFTPPSEGFMGGPCRTSGDACNQGLSCTGDNGHGMCVGGDFKKPPFAPCSANAECFSETCTNNVCTFGGDFQGGTHTTGQSCGGPGDCASFFCDAGLCVEPPDNFQEFIDPSNLKGEGESCTAPNQCFSFNCAGGVCGAPGGPPPGGDGWTPPTNLPAGSFCMGNAECQSLHCNQVTHVCE